MSDVDICANINQIKKEIEEVCTKSGRDPNDITLIAVSKTKPVEFILKAAECGQLHFGENRMKELEDKMAEIQNSDLSWHMIGNIQTNKIKYIAHRIDWIHSVDKEKYLAEIDKRAGQAERTINVLIQVNISNEQQKGGCAPDGLAEILKGAQKYNNLRVRGLMGMASIAEDPEEIRAQFRLLKQLFDEHQTYNSGNVSLEHLSMGMTGDFRIAIEEGATMVRIGSAIFGARNYG